MIVNVDALLLNLIIYTVYTFKREKPCFKEWSIRSQNMGTRFLCWASFCEFLACRIKPSPGLFAPSWASFVCLLRAFWGLLFCCPHTSPTFSSSNVPCPFSPLKWESICTFFYILPVAWNVFPLCIPCENFSNLN